MNLKVTPVQTLKGSLWLPASKSYSIRAFLIAACQGSSVLVRPSHCDDALVAKQVAVSLGAAVNRRKDRWAIRARQRNTIPKTIEVRESGTVLRFLLPLVSLYTDQVTIEGKGTLRGRPNAHLTKSLRAMGLNIRGTGPKESVPIRIEGGQLMCGKMEIDGSLSSQFVSALLITAPQLCGDSVLTKKGRKQVSTDYIEMTEKILKRAGVHIHKKDNKTYLIPGNQKFKGLKNFSVPSDYGLAAFHLAAASLIKSNITLKGHFDDSLNQADGHIIPLMRKMGCRMAKNKASLNVKGPFQLKGGSFSLKNCPDLVPIMAVLALFAKGKTRLYDIAHVRTKESNRISDLRKELKKIGAHITEKNDEMTIIPQSQYKGNCLLDPHNDHRLAMAFSVLGAKIGVQVKNIGCTSKSYPDFVKDFESLGVSLRRL